MVWRHIRPWFLLGLWWYSVVLVYVYSTFMNTLVVKGFIEVILILQNQDLDAWQTASTYVIEELCTSLPYHDTALPHLCHVMMPLSHHDSWEWIDERGWPVASIVDKHPSSSSFITDSIHIYVQLSGLAAWHQVTGHACIQHIQCFWPSLVNIH